MINNKLSVIKKEEFYEQVIGRLKLKGKLYAKKTNVFARVAGRNERVVTIVSDGVETVNYANEGDYIVENQTSSKERYIVPKTKFEARYELAREVAGGFSEYVSTGKVWALELTKKSLDALGLADEFNFEAPWGENSVARKGDYLVSPPDFSEVYRIAKKEFRQTYRRESGQK